MLNCRWCQEFRQCPDCQDVYRRRAHYRRMRCPIAQLAAAPAP